jgi:hypothetical protein
MRICEGMIKAMEGALTDVMLRLQNTTISNLLLD